MENILANMLTGIRYQDWVLHALLIIPIVGAVAVALSPAATAKRLALVITIVEFLVSAPLWFMVNTSTGTMELVSTIPWIPQWGISYAVGIDGISLMMVLLTTLLMPLCVLGSFNYITEQIGRAHV